MKIRILVAVLVTMVLAVSAAAELNCWFPYANVAKRATTTYCPLWGGPSVDEYIAKPYLQWDWPLWQNQVPNVIWPEDDTANVKGVYYTSGGSKQSWYDIAGWTKSFLLNLQNSSTWNFVNAERLKVYLYNPDGSVVDEATTWNGSPAGVLVINTNIGNVPNSCAVWDSVENCFLVTLPIAQSCTLSAINDPLFFEQYRSGDVAYNYPNMFNHPGVDHCFKPMIRVCQPNSHPFTAEVRGEFYSPLYRTSAYGFSANKHIIFQTYEGTFDTEFESEVINRAVLPHFVERHDPNAEIESSTAIYLTNASDVEDTLQIYILEPQSYNVITDVPVTLQPHETIYFLPSQFYTSWPGAGGVTGHIRVYGQKPVAMAHHMRYTKSPYTISNYKTRISDATVERFQIEQPDEN